MAPPTRRQTLRAVPGLDGHTGLQAYTTTRLGGVSTGPFASLNLALHVGDAHSRVLANREIVSRALGIDPGSWTVGQQVHGGRVAVVSSSERGRGAFGADDAIAAADGLVTDVPDVCLAVMVADCVPVLLYDPRRRAIGVAHAGWRGTVAHVASAAVSAMRSAFGSRPEDLRAHLGPSIGPRDYVVGADVARAIHRAYAQPGPRFAREAPGGRWLVDLWSANAQDLISAGLRAAHIGVSGVSTVRHADTLYSHRALGRTGRFAALLRLAPP